MWFHMPYGSSAAIFRSLTDFQRGHDAHGRIAGRYSICGFGEQHQLYAPDPLDRKQGGRSVMVS